MARNVRKYKNEYSMMCNVLKKRKLMVYCGDTSIRWRVEKKNMTAIQSSTGPHRFKNFIKPVYTLPSSLGIPYTIGVTTVTLFV